MNEGILASALARQVADREGDYLGAAEALADMLESGGATEPVLLHWSREHGDCIDCGLPAAFFAPDRFGGWSDAHVRNIACAICAANWAAEGNVIRRIEKGAPGMGDNPGTKVYTVIGLWNDGVPLAAGAIEGVHAVDGDLDYIGFQPWATSVEADGPDEAMETAVERMQ